MFAPPGCRPQLAGQISPQGKKSGVLDIVLGVHMTEIKLKQIIREGVQKKLLF